MTLLKPTLTIPRPAGGGSPWAEITSFRLPSYFNLTNRERVTFSDHPSQSLDDDT